MRTRYAANRLNPTLDSVNRLHVNSIKINLGVCPAKITVSNISLDLTADMLLTETNLVALLYLVLSGTYLLVLPGLVYLYLSKRWYTAGSIERLIMYLFVFLSFPGMLLLSPFLNFRPKRRDLKA